MSTNERKTMLRQFRASLITTMLVLTSLSLGALTASAVGPNQSDLGYNGDLPDNSTAVTTSQAVINVSGLAPFSSGVLYGEFDVGDDEDWFSVQLNANEGLTVEINYNSTYLSLIHI